MRTVGLVLTIVPVVLIFPGAPLLFVFYMSRWNRESAKKYGEKIHLMAFKPWIYWSWVRLDQTEKYPLVGFSIVCLAVAVGLSLLIQSGLHR